MRRPTLAAASLATIFCMAMPSRAAEQWKTVCNVSVPATMVDSVDSATAFPGMRFRFRTRDAVKFGHTYIPRGTMGYGYVRTVSAASNRDRNGSLVLEPREVVVDNRSLNVMADPRQTYLWAQATTLADKASGYLPIPGLIRTAVNEVRDGRNVTIGPGFNFDVIPFGDPRDSEPCRKVVTSR